MAAVTAMVATTAYGAYSANRNAKASRALQREGMDAQSAIADRQLAISEEQWNLYKQNYLPMELEYLDTAKNFGSQANQEQAATRAAADVKGAFAGARQNLITNPGINPNSSQYAKESARIAMGEAAATAAAETAARDNVRTTGANMLASAAGKGQTLPSAASGGLSAAGGIYGSLASQQGAAAGAYGQQAGQAVAGIGSMLGGMSRSGMLTTAANNYSDIFSGMSGLFSTQPTPEMINSAGYGAP
jgi:hypothetical protein